MRNVMESGKQLGELMIEREINRVDLTGIDSHTKILNSIQMECMRCIGSMLLNSTLPSFTKSKM